MAAHALSSLCELYEWWENNPQVWFGATPKDDAWIASEFGYLAESDMDVVLEGEEVWSSSCKEIVGWVIAHDQIPYHCRRARCDGGGGGGSEAKVVGVCLRFLEEEMTPFERVFMLLPLRHTKNLSMMRIALDRIKRCRVGEFVDNSLYVRFYRATLLDIGECLVKEATPRKVDEAIGDEEVYSILDARCYEYLTANSIVSGGTGTSAGRVCGGAFADAFKSIIRQNPSLTPRRVVISLSGGVDSMVCSYLATHLLGRENVTAVHIDYGNREDVSLENELVTRWCAALGIPIYVLSIVDIKRDRTHDRDLYESVTKQLRFKMYARFEGMSVILGHNDGDILENILTNTIEQRFDNLRGMKAIGEDSGVTLLRPLLAFSKKEIWEFAREHSIPHLPNSTPEWSRRGQCRTRWLPALESFDAGLVPGLRKLADAVEEMNSIVNEYADSVCRHLVFDDEERVLVNVVPSKACGYVVWKTIIYFIVDKLCIQPISHKSINSFVTRIKEEQFGAIMMSRELRAVYDRKSLRFEKTNIGAS